MPSYSSRGGSGPSVGTSIFMLMVVLWIAHSLIHAVQDPIREHQSLKSDDVQRDKVQSKESENARQLQSEPVKMPTPTTPLTTRPTPTPPRTTRPNQPTQSHDSWVMVMVVVVVVTVGAVMLVMKHKSGAEVTAQDTDVQETDVQETDAQKNDLRERLSFDHIRYNIGTPLNPIRVWLSDQSKYIWDLSMFSHFLGYSCEPMLDLKDYWQNQLYLFRFFFYKATGGRLLYADYIEQWMDQGKHLDLADNERRDLLARNFAELLVKQCNQTVECNQAKFAEALQHHLLMDKKYTEIQMIGLINNLQNEHFGKVLQQ